MWGLSKRGSPQPYTHSTPTHTRAAGAAPSCPKSAVSRHFDSFFFRISLGSMLVFSIFWFKLWRDFHPHPSADGAATFSRILAISCHFDTFFVRISSGIWLVSATFWSTFWSEFSSVRPIEPRPDSETVWIFGPGGVPQKVAVSPKTLFNSFRFNRGTTSVFGSKSGFLGFGCRWSAENC